MHFDRDKYEKLIKDTPLFSISKEDEPQEYKKESYRLIENLYCYLMAINKMAYEPYAYEIIDISTRCISNFDSSKGIFLHYFNAAWKQEYSHLTGNQIVENKFRGIKITEDEKRDIRKYIKLTEGLETGCDKNELYQHIAEAMEIPVEKVRLIAELNEIRVCGDSVKNDDDEEISVWEQVSDGRMIEEEFAEADSIEDLFQKIEKTYEILQERQKPIIADMITAKIWTLVSEQQSRKYNFISNEIISLSEKTGRSPTQREIADKYGRDEASISRTVKEFILKLKREM